MKSNEKNDRLTHNNGSEHANVQLCDNQLQVTKEDVTEREMHGHMHVPKREDTPGVGEKQTQGGECISISLSNIPHNMTKEAMLTHMTPMANIDPNNVMLKNGFAVMHVVGSGVIEELHKVLVECYRAKQRGVTPTGVPMQALGDGNRPIG